MENVKQTQQNNNNQKPLISIIIPVFNESKTIAKAVQRIHDLPISKEIIVVDDCSTDGSREIIDELKKKINFKLITNTPNKGKGASVLAASKIATGKYIIVEDSDLELNSQDILTMLEIIQTQKVDLVNGNRNVISNKNTNYISKIAKVVTKTLLFLLYGKTINDLLSSYKLCTLENFFKLDLQSQRFGFETEWIIKALKQKWFVKEVLIDYYPRKVNDGKKITAMDGIDIIWNIIKYRF
jgi:glycosyltransferase involved in cell wall biosynthesis